MKMEDNQCSSTPTQIEEEFIELEVSPKILPASSIPKSCSPPHSREFEFQMSSSHLLHTTRIPPEDSATTPSPADDLFYKGKLLPLHLPPRLQMVQKLLLQQTSINSPSSSRHQTFVSEQKGEEETIHIQPMNPTAPLITTKSFTAPPTISNTPLESCNISPTESCRVSCELNPDEHFFHWSTTESTAFIGFNNKNRGCGSDGGNDGQNARKSWTRRLRIMKQQPSSLTQKLRAASRAYLKSLFLTTKSPCSDEVNCSNNKNPDEEVEEGRREAWNMLKAREYLNKYIKIVKKMNYPFGQTENIKPQQQQEQKQALSSSFTMKSILDREIMTDDENQTTFTCHRRSFSGAIKRHCTSKCYTSFSSSSSSSQSSSSNCSSSNSSNSSFSLPKSTNGFYEINLLKRSTSANSELENSVEGAIAHCKKSHQMKLKECLGGNNGSGPKSDQQQLGSSLLSASTTGGCNKRTELGRI